VDVLDVGTGPGQIAMDLARLGHRVTGIDIVPEMVDRARSESAGASNPPVFRRGDATEPPFPAGSFDAVVARHLLWTLPEPERALRNWRRLLRPGGRVAVAIWVPPTRPDRGAGRPSAAGPYSAGTVAALPLAGKNSPGPSSAALTGVGFDHVTAREITALHELERRSAEESGDLGPVGRQYLLTGFR
jgi:SAM-dependent methyltransferase